MTTTTLKKLKIKDASFGDLARGINQIVEHLNAQKQSTLTDDAVALAERCLEYVGYGKIEPVKNCDLEIQQMSLALLAKAGPKQP